MGEFRHYDLDIAESENVSRLGLHQIIEHLERIPRVCERFCDTSVVRERIEAHACDRVDEVTRPGWDGAGFHRFRSWVRE